MLTPTARDAIDGSENDIFISAVSAWEIANKFRRGKWPEVEVIARNVAAEVLAQGFAELAVTVRHAQAAGELPEPHRDPFNRLLIAQALEEDMTIVSNERVFDAYGVSRLW